MAIAGAVYGFDKSLDSPVKFPPQMDNTFVGFDFDIGTNNPLWIFNLDTKTMKVVKQTRADNALFAGIALRKPLQALFGSEGALYILNYDGFYTTVNPAVYRIDYVGTCRVPVSARRDGNRELEIDFAADMDGITVEEAGRHAFTLTDLAGHRLFRAEGEKGARYGFWDLKARLGLAKGLHLVSIRSKKGEILRKAVVP